MRDIRRSKDLKTGHGKTPWYLFPMFAAEPIVRVLEHGASKYRKWNWREGLPDEDFFERYYSSCLRHMDAGLLAIVEGRSTNDEESGLSHFAHAATNLLFILAWEQWRAKQTAADTLHSGVRPSCDVCDGSGLIGTISDLQVECGGCR